jgi:hypothetical protein
MRHNNADFVQFHETVSVRTWRIMKYTILERVRK